MPTGSRLRTRSAVPLLLAGILALGACQSAPEPRPDSDADQGPFPVELDNCGADISIAEPPSRVVTIKSAATELVLALDRSDLLIGTAAADDELPSRLPGAGAVPADVPVLAEQVPAAEVVLGAEPDLIIAGWESNLTAETIGERDELADLGITSYVLPAACQDEEYQPDPLEFEDVFAQITEVGRLLDASDEAAALVAHQRDQLDDVDAAAGDVSALWYSSGSDTPFVGAGIGAPELIMSTIGLRNIYADTDDTWTSVSWESVAAADPDVIVLVDSQWNTAAHKQQVLAENPVTASLDAVAEERYVTVPFPASEAGVRTAGAAADLADQLSDLEAR